jgi:origin recognition complex subunit 6
MLCTELETRKAIPHVLAGVESVLCLPPPQIEDNQEKGKDKKMEGKIPALIAAVWFWVLGRLTGKDTNGEEYKKRRQMVMNVLATVESSEWVAERVSQEEGTWVGWETVGSKDIQGWVIELKEKAWLEMDWYENIVEDPDVDGVGDGEDEELESSRTFEELSRAGLGTMKLDKFDYLTERKRAEYEVWKGKMLRMIDELVEEGVLDDEGEEMDTAEG